MTGGETNRVLIIGIPRSGTTWVAHILAHAEDTTFLNEPDNHLSVPYALLAKRRLRGGFHPALRPNDGALAYERLWQSALSSLPLAEPAYSPTERLRRAASQRLLASASQQQKWAAFGASRPSLRLLAAERLAIPERPQRNASNVVVKSVYAALSVEWITARFPVRVVVVRRAPLNILSSWSEIGWLGRPGDDMLDTLERSVQVQLAAKWGVDPPEPGASVFSRAAWLIGALSSELDETASRNSGWIGVTHEDLCERPHERFRALAEACGLRWSQVVDHVLDETNRSGRGYDLFRVGHELRDAWRLRLSSGEVAEALTVLERFSLDTRGQVSDQS